MTYSHNQRHIWHLFSSKTKRNCKTVPTVAGPEPCHLAPGACPALLSMALLAPSSPLPTQPGTVHRHLPSTWLGGLQLSLKPVALRPHAVPRGGADMTRGCSHGLGRRPDCPQHPSPGVERCWLPSDDKVPVGVFLRKVAQVAAASSSVPTGQRALLEAGSAFLSLHSGAVQGGPCGSLPPSCPGPWRPSSWRHPPVSRGPGRRRVERRLGCCPGRSQARVAF